MNKRKLLVSILAGFLVAVMLFGLIASLIPSKVSAASSSEIKAQIKELQKQKDELREQMKDVQDQYSENEDEITDMVNQKNMIDQEIFLLYAEIENINLQLSAYSLLIADKQDELDLANAKLEQLRTKNKERIRTMEEDGAISYWAVLFKANSFADLLDRLNMIEEIAAADQKRLQEMNLAAEEVASAQAELEEEKDELELAKDELDAVQQELDAKRAEAEAILTELIAKGYELQELYKEMKQGVDDLLDEIAIKEQEYNEAKHQEWLDYMATYTTAPPETTEPAPSGGGSGGGGSGGGGSGGGSGGGGGTGSTTWLVPCSYVMLTSPFGPRQSPTPGASTYHKGVDLAGPQGTPIYASRTGVVSIASYSNAGGYYVTINHGDGYSSQYLHMTNYVVRTGQAVSAGQLIGYMGSTGISTGSHLHFGIVYNGTYVNPANYMYLHP